MSLPVRVLLTVTALRVMPLTPMRLGGMASMLALIL
jgi:hypothetical protein